MQVVMHLGAHCGVVGGFGGALARALELRCQAMQMLPYRRHHEDAAEDFAGFSRRRREAGIETLLIHSRFVPSLASSDPDRRRRSVQQLAFELGLAKAWGAHAYVLHAGAYSPGASAREGLRLAVESVAQAWGSAEGLPPVYLENVPGGGRRLGGTLEELAALIEAIRGRGVPVFACLDTAHAWAAGYDMSTAEGMLKFLSRAHRLMDAANVLAFHLNDSDSLLGSHREHHACWGDGRLGLEGLKVLLSRPEYSLAAGILEVPPGPGEARSLELLRSL